MEKKKLYKGLRRDKDQSKKNPGEYEILDVKVRTGPSSVDSQSKVLTPSFLPRGKAMENLKLTLLRLHFPFK